MHAETLVAEAQARGGATRSDDIDTVLELIKRLIRETVALNPAMIKPIEMMAKARLHAYLEAGAASLSAVRHVELPDEIWCGSAGHRPVRTIALEVRRRAGRVVVFDHAASAGLFSDGDSLALVELSVVSRFVANTEETKMLAQTNDSLARVAIGNAVELVGGQGDPYFSLRMRPRGANSINRKKVLYVVGAFDGMARRSPPSLPDPLKLDWWIRVAAILSGLPIEFMIQAHPGGVVRGRPNPLLPYAPLSNRRFEEMRSWADLLVIDVTQSTTLTEAFCTDLPIVLIDYGRNVFATALQPMVAQRCRTVRARFDSFNRPHLDSGELEDAVMTAPFGADPTYFRRAFAGQYA
ncbi:MAG: hypothetical protein EXQ99_03590 [Alphaproteobacteria bacterium]|nr:hypothetical protein [Alphaproteobacteria bacterium]